MADHMRHWLCIALHVFAILACTKHKERSSPADRADSMDARIAETTRALAEASDPTGWPSVTDCDGTLWAGLACGGGVPVAIELAEYEPGQIHRRPAPSCWDGEDRGAKSTVSPDMLLGYMLCRLEQGDLAALQRLADFGETHDWVMGQPPSEVGRVVMKPNLIGILGRAIFKLSGGKDDRDYRHLPVVFPTVAEDYEQHLQALGIVMQGEVTESAEALLDIDGAQLERLHALVDADPRNPGFQTALGIYTGDMDPAVDLFLDPKTPTPSYVRGDRPQAFALAERLFWMKKARARMRD